MRADILGAVLLAAVLAVPGAAMASHMGLYRTNPVEHDDQGRSDEPDFVSTSVLGVPLDNCFLELPVAGAFAGRCTRPLPQPLAGQAATLAPGCTGLGLDGQRERKLAGQCGLWSIGATNGLVPPQAPLPASERGLPGDAAPGAFTPTKTSAVRFLDGHFQQAVHNPTGSVARVDVNHKLADAGRLSGLAVLPFHTLVLPGQQQNALWYGQWTDRNGNGVIDHVRPGTAGSTQNEFAWLGGCRDYDTRKYNSASLSAGVCIEDPNPNAAPPGAPCADPASAEPCAGTTVVAWHWPGNHHAGYGEQFPLPNDVPAQQAVHWSLNECAGYAGCDEPDVLYRGDPLLGPQDARVVDTAFYDYTGSLTGAGAASDIVRDWHPGGGYSHAFYGDDGLLVTMVSVYGANCVEVAPGYAYDPATCTFHDVDRHEAVHPAFNQLLVGSTEDPTGGLKGLARGAWVLVRDL